MVQLSEAALTEVKALTQDSSLDYLGVYATVLTKMTSS